MAIVEDWEWFLIWALQPVFQPVALCSTHLVPVKQEVINLQLLDTMAYGKQSVQNQTISCITGQSVQVL